MACTVGIAPTARAQVQWGLGRWQGEGTFFLDWENQDDKRAQTKYETILFQERLGLRNLGAFLIDPRFLTLDLGGSFGLSQEDNLAANQAPLRVGDGTLYDYAFDGLFLSDQPYVLSAFANRSQNRLTQGFGGESNTSFESRGGVLEFREGSFLENYGIFNFSSLLDVHQEFLNEDSSVFGSPFKRDESRNIVRYHTHKGGETSDVDLRYEFNDVSDPLNPTDVFNSHTVRALHSIDFGPTLNRRLDSVAYYFVRTGSGPGTFLSVDEGLHIDHQSNLATDCRYSFSQSDSEGAGVTTTNGGNLGVVHQPYRQLTTTLYIDGAVQSFPTGDRDIYGGQGGVAYRRSLPWHGQLFVDTSVGYHIDDNNFTSSEINVVDEPHTAPPVFGAGAGFTLNNSFVVNESIVMVDVRGGSRLPTELDVDYVLSQEGSLTKIIPLPGSPVIRPNDPLEVSYTYNIDPSIKYATTTWNIRTGADFDWVAAWYEHALSDQSRLAGEASPQFLINQNIDRLKLDLRQQWNNLRALGSVAYEIVNSTVVDSRTWRFAQSLMYQPRPELIAQISGDEYLTHYPSESRTANSYLVRSTLDWFVPPGITISAFAGYRVFQETDVASDEIVESGIRAHWTYQNLDISPSFTWTDYRGRLDDFRGELRIVRHLF
ncbi:MAG TPA: hypothetical protein VMW17_07485 [Candidatus Binatia bacterium]|nr:hypothetical protein [Candidatus Binatia bacterium]